MKHLILAAAFTTAFFVMPASTSTAQEKSAAKTTAAATAAPYKHIVLFKFKDDAPADKVKAVVEAFKALKAKLPAIKSLEWGTNISPENLNQGFTHCFTLSFESKEALEKHYLHEKAHKDFGAMLGPLLDKVLVIDFLAE